MFFNALRSKPSPPLCRPLEEQEERESQKLWFKTAQAVIDRNHELATDEKTKVEEQQREEAALRANDGIEWRPRLFRAVKGGPGGAEEGEEDLEWIINAQMFVVATLDNRKHADTTHTEMEPRRRSRLSRLWRYIPLSKAKSGNPSTSSPREHPAKFPILGTVTWSM